jgi:histidinol-phosphate aminotransferase
VPLTVPPRFRNLAPYRQGKPISEVQREFGIKTVVKLASNENPLGPSPAAIAAISAAAADANLYPDASSHDLKQALSAKYGISAEHIMVGAGSDELIHYLSELFLSPGDEIVMGDPGFVRYGAGADLVGATTRFVPMRANGSHDLGVMLEAITEKTRIVWIANPNNPTGGIVKKGELDAFLQKCPGEIAVVLDEAYFEYVDDAEYPDSLDYVKSGAPVIGLRTFSKAYGLAALRVGYGFALENVARAVESVREPFNVNALAQAAAVAALDDTQYRRSTIDANRNGMTILTKILTDCGASITPSHGNFIWADFFMETDAICERLLTRGVVVRPGSVFGKPTCMRITVGTAHQLEILERALHEAIS